MSNGLGLKSCDQSCVTCHGSNVVGTMVPTYYTWFQGGSNCGSLSRAAILNCPLPESPRRSAWRLLLLTRVIKKRWDYSARYKKKEKKMLLFSKNLIFSHFYTYDPSEWPVWGQVFALAHRWPQITIFLFSNMISYTLEVYLCCHRVMKWLLSKIRVISINKQ